MAILVVKQIICFLVGGAVAFVSTNTSGGALLMIPSLMYLGLGPAQSVATMRLATSVSMVASIPQFHRAGKIHYRLSLLVAMFAVTGTIVGALLLPHIDATLLCRLIGIGNIIILLLLLWRRVGLQERDLGGWRWLTLPLFTLAGLVGAMVGGLSTYVTFLMVACFGRTYSEAGGTRKVVGLVSATVAVVLHYRSGLVDFSLGIPLAVGGALGGYLGSGYGLRRGDRWLGRAFMVMVLVASLRLILK